jgi:hypothetical protein
LRTPDKSSEEIPMAAPAFWSKMTFSKVSTLSLFLDCGLFEKVNKNQKCRFSFNFHC